LGDLIVANKLDRRETLAIIGAAVALTTTAPTTVAAANLSATTVLIEETFLKANEGLRKDLADFITKNWFVMDEEGVKQGIFTSYWLMEDIDENADWDLVVAVGYPQLGGYEDPATKAKFNAISAMHKEVLINGNNLKALGKIVRHHRLKISGGNHRITVTN
jgi:hypothetical protein